MKWNQYVSLNEGFTHRDTQDDKMNREENFDKESPFTAEEIEADPKKWESNDGTSGGYDAKLISKAGKEYLVMRDEARDDLNYGAERYLIWNVIRHLPDDFDYDSLDSDNESNYFSLGVEIKDAGNPDWSVETEGEVDNSIEEDELLVDAGFKQGPTNSGFPYSKEKDNGDLFKIYKDVNDKFVISFESAKTHKTQKKVFDTLTVAIQNQDRFEDDLEEQAPVNLDPSTVTDKQSITVKDLPKLNVQQLTQLKTLISQKDQIDKKIADLKKQMSTVKESMNEEEELTEDSANAQQMISLFNELNKMEKRHNRILAQITSQLEKEKEDLHLQIKDIMGKEKAERNLINVEAVTEGFSFHKYFTNDSFKNDVDSIIESLSEEQKIIITNKIIAKRLGKTNLFESVSAPDKTELLECVEFYGAKHFRCRFIAEAFAFLKEGKTWKPFKDLDPSTFDGKMTNEDNYAVSEAEQPLEEMAIRQSKQAYILRWKDGTKPQQYLYPFTKGDKASEDAAKEKAIEAATKKIANKKNDVRVEDGRDGTTITGDALKLGRTSGTTKKEILVKAKKARDTASFLLISYRTKATGEIEEEEDEDKIRALVPTLLKELEKLDRDLLDFEEDFSKEHKVQLTIDLYKSKADAVRNVLINKRLHMASVLVDMESGDVLHLGTEIVNTSDEINYNKDVFKDDDKEVKNDKLVDKDIDDEEEEVKPKEKKAPSAAQLAARKKFASGSRGLDKKTQGALNSGKKIEESVSVPKIVVLESQYSFMKKFL